MFYFCNMLVEYSSNIYLLNLTTYVTTVLVSEHSESIQKKHSHNIFKILKWNGNPKNIFKTFKKLDVLDIQRTVF